MITLKSAHEIELMRRAGKITAAARALAREMVKPGYMYAVCALSRLTRGAEEASFS